MKFNDIKEHWDVQHAALMKKIDEMAEERVRQLVEQLKRFGIRSICMAMGCWSLCGNKVYVQSKDEDREKFKVELDEMQYWIDNPYSVYWNPIGITTIELQAWKELVQLCDWLTHTTGGNEMEF